MAEIHSGGCARGAVRYRVHGEPAFGTMSHAAEIRPGMRTIAAGTFDDPVPRAP